MPLQGKRPAADPRKLRHALVLVRWGSDALAEFVAGLAERETKIIRSKIGKNQLTLAITAAATSVKARFNLQKKPNRAEAGSPSGFHGLDRFSKLWAVLDLNQ